MNKKVKPSQYASTMLKTPKHSQVDHGSLSRCREMFSDNHLSTESVSASAVAGIRECRGTGSRLARPPLLCVAINNHHKFPCLPSASCPVPPTPDDANPTFEAKTPTPQHQGNQPLLPDKSRLVSGPGMRQRVR